MVRVGQKLREERLRLGLTLEDIARSTKIKVGFLSAIEKGEYQKLPSSTYAYGFVRNYAERLGLPKSETLALFRREFDEEKVFELLPEGLAKSLDFPIRRLRLSSAGIFVILAFLALLGYILFQYRFVIINPSVEIISPKESEVSSSQEITVLGKTDSNAIVYVNNNPVSVDQDGIFKKTLDLFIGKATITIKSVNRFGRQTTVERHIEVKSSP